jgi:hypothetical protein
MKTKAFDCVRIKQQSQRELRSALNGKSPGAQAAEIARRATTDPIWRDLVRLKGTPARVRKAGSARR